jgi:excisionase family DNA binding protein
MGVCGGVLTVRDLAGRLGCSVSNVYELVAKGELSCWRVGARGAGIRFSEEHVQEFLRCRQTRGAGPATRPAPAPRPAGDFTILDGDRLRKAWQGREP